MLSDYSLVYEITVMPHILFASLTPANEYYQFDKGKLFIPKELLGSPIECRFALFDKEGNLTELVHRIETSSTLIPILNTIPLRMINTLLEKLTAQITSSNPTT